jgi:methionyl-tRNA formyltransferase/peptide deformylase
MKKEDIITLPNVHLRQKSQKVHVLTDEVSTLIADMTSAALDWEDSRPHEISAALAAVQIDRLERVVIIRSDFDDKSNRDFTVLINPEIVKYEGSIIHDYEGCLSVSSVYGKVPRYSKVRVKALSEDGHEIRLKAEGFLARVLQHEIDHCNGIVFIDHIKDTPDAFYTLNDAGELDPLNYEQDIKAPIVFFGTEDFSVASLRALIDTGFPISLVITKPDSKRGRGQKLTPPSVKILAQNHGVPVLQPHRLADCVPDIMKLTTPVGVLVSFGKIIPTHMIDLFTPGIINVHPSLLPRYRGPSPIESAIAHGDETTGVSIMQLSAAMDAGPVYSQTHHPLTQTETQSKLYDTLAVEGAAELVRILPAILNGSLTPIAQDDAQASYCQLLSKNDSLVDPAKLTASEIERRIRAYHAFPKTRLHLHEVDMIVSAAHVVDREQPHAVRCRDNSWLLVTHVISPASGKSMPLDAYLRGQRR